MEVALPNPKLHSVAILVRLMVSHSQDGARIAADLASHLAQIQRDPQTVPHQLTSRPEWDRWPS